jgi:uncharacterized protein
MIRPYVWLIPVLLLISFLTTSCSLSGSLAQTAPTITTLLQATQPAPLSTSVLGTTTPPSALSASSATPTANSSTATLAAATGMTPTANTGSGTGLARTITVNGQGSASGTPDIAQVSVGVQVVASTVTTATQQNNEKMTAVIGKLKSLGIADNDIQTTNFSVFPQRSNPIVPNQEGTITGYQVSNTVQVTVRDSSRIGAVLDGATQAGANEVFGVNFGVSSPAKLQAQARVQAVTDAQARADDLARLAGVQRGEVLSISETTAPSPAPLAAAGLGGGAVPVQPGQISAQVQVEITYALR